MTNTKRKEEMENIFDYKLIKKAIGIKWWEKLLLLFCWKRYYGFDYGYGKDKSVLVVAKKLFGKVYIIKENIS